MKLLTGDKAHEHLTQLLELPADSPWDDVVYYTAKAKSSVRMANASVERRMTLLAEALGMDPATTSWPQMLERVKELMSSGRWVVSTIKTR